MNPEALFLSHFEAPSSFSVRAPGRVNLIGEHVDYNQGVVLPAAIHLEVRITGSPNRLNRVRAVSDAFGSGVINLGSLTPESVLGWERYLAGAAWALQQQGIKVPGVDLAITSDIPVGAGLSSSAALQVAACLAFERAAGIDLGPVARAKIAYISETEFVGLQCGAMDMTVSAMAQEGCALLFDTLTGETQPVPIDPKRAVIVIANTNRPHELVTSAYNERCEECRRAVEIIQARHPKVTSLRHADLEQVTELSSTLGEVLSRRARHVVTEIERARVGANQLIKGDYVGFGNSMWASHQSLKEDYEVSCEELDALVSAAGTVPGVYGSRLTGAGFGGCTVSLVKPSAVDRFIEQVGQIYQEQTGLHANFIVTHPCRGAGEVV